MTTEYIDIEGKWGVVICHNLYRRDVRDMRAYMESFGLPDEKIDEVIRILLYHDNTGYCINSFRLRMSLIFIGSATSEDQFWDTVGHELYHCQQSILDYYNVSKDSEDAAWTYGYLMRKAVQLIGELCMREA